MPLLPTLKKETSSQHASLEQSLDLLRRAATLEGYRDLIWDFFQLYRPLEQRLEMAADWNSKGWDFGSRRKLPWLVEDVGVLPGGSEERFSREQDLPDVANFGRALGCLYVIEGSTLGGQVISRHLRGMLGLTPESGARFFSGYGPETVEKWREFGQWAEEQASVAPGLIPEAVDAARETFVCFERWLVR